jgi:two-component system chemotaxis response regulator CheY
MIVRQGNLADVKTILIVDDSSLIRRILSSLLTTSGEMVCEEAGNGYEAIVKAQQIHPDLIILDLSMPQMNGLEAAQELQRLMPAIPLLMFTTHLTSELEREATRTGIREVISKSDGAQAVIKSIRTLLAA